MSLSKIENNLKKLITNFDKENFIYDFLLAFDQPKSSINRLKKGDYNKSKQEDEIIWSKKIYFKKIRKEDDVHYVIDDLSKNKNAEKFKVRFLIVTDFNTFLAKDLKNHDTLDIDINKIYLNANFFMPLTGLEKAENISENLADVKAAYKMGKLFDILIKDNPKLNDNERSKHHLNLFFSKG